MPTLYHHIFRCDCYFGFKLSQITPLMWEITSRNFRSYRPKFNFWPFLTFLGLIMGKINVSYLPGARVCAFTNIVSKFQTIIIFPHSFIFNKPASFIVKIHLNTQAEPSCLNSMFPSCVALRTHLYLNPADAEFKCI